jgi:hypothetical protein
MKGKRVAVVVSHPAHLLTVAGMLLRWRPHVLLLTRAAGGAAGQEDAIRSALAAHGLSDRLTSFEVSEEESFGRVLAGDFAFHAAVGDRIFGWLREVRPDAVLGDAYEAYNFQHDLTRLLIDDVVQRWRNLGRRIENYEFPLSCRIDSPGAPVRYGEFPSGSRHELRLSAGELAAKREVVARVGRADPFVAGVAPLFPRPGVETYREVPPDRDYTAPPPGLALYYDERGREVVAAGRYGEAITFRGHFAPLVRALGLGPAARSAAA